MKNNTNILIRRKKSSDQIFLNSFILKLFGKLFKENEFEDIVKILWKENKFLIHSKELAESIELMVSNLDDKYTSTYGSDTPNIDFYSKWLINELTLPGAIYVDAPKESIIDKDLLTNLNRNIHCHDSPRAAFIIKGNPIFHFRKEQDGNISQYLLELKPGDFICWPKNIHHTFNAMEGFSLLSIIGSYLEPDSDGYSYPIKNNNEILKNQKVVKITTLDNFE